MKSFNEFIEEQLQNPDVKKAYDELVAEFDTIQKKMDNEVIRE